MKDYSFGNFLHELRVHRGLTQYQLGTLVGVSDKAVSKWENGSSRPQSSLLYKLSEVLGVSVDELLTCKYHSLDNKDSKGVFAMKKELWNKAHDAMRQRYGDHLPLEITNRFLTERAEMYDTDMIVYFDALSTLVCEAKKRQEHICAVGGIGASFVAFLLGATDVDPLVPHYYCPDCKRVVFDVSARDGWDLPRKKCICQRKMISDGHDLSFDTYRHVVHRNTSFHVMVSPGFSETAASVIKEYFKDCRMTFTAREDGYPTTVKVSSDRSECAFTFSTNQEFERYRALQLETATSFDRIPFLDGEVLRRFRDGDTSGIPEFRTEFAIRVLKAVDPASFCDLIQIPGLCHGSGTWFDNAERLIGKGYGAGDVIAYRDDVFRRVRQKMLGKGLADGGFAYKVMEDTRRGLYAKNGIPDDVKVYLSDIGAQEALADSVGKINYLFPKAHGVACVKIAAILMWYKLNYPEEFERIMK